MTFSMYLSMRRLGYDRLFILPCVITNYRAMELAGVSALAHGLYERYE